MGKTRVIAASILQNVYDGRGKHLFITASSNLFENLNIECQKLNAPNNFRTITLKEREKFKTGILFLTYMDLRDNYNFIIELMNPNFDGIVSTQLLLIPI